jgi:hypothetical protein
MSFNFPELGMKQKFEVEAQNGHYEELNIVLSVKTKEEQSVVVTTKTTSARKETVNAPSLSKKILIPLHQLYLQKRYDVRLIKALVMW